MHTHLASCERGTHATVDLPRTRVRDIRRNTLMPEPIDTRLSRLRERAERAIASGRRGGEVLGVLETMTREAPDGSAHALFAHRHLAEMQLQGSPWRAALHLRRVTDAGAADDSVHALMGLCQALLGNYRAAVSAYRKAVHLAPRNPWYHHNLGHLLDVGLHDSLTALDHLRIAHRLQRQEDEIAASLAHCLARLGHLDEARTMAEQAVHAAPRNRDHRVLLDWIVEGAPDDKAPLQRTSHAPGSSTLIVADANELSGERAQGGEVAAQVSSLLEQQMPVAGFSFEDVALAHRIWADFHGRLGAVSGKPAVYAAAVEYAVAKLSKPQRGTQAQTARRYGVTARALSTRYEDLRSALALVPCDPRYCC